MHFSMSAAPSINVKSQAQGQGLPSPSLKGLLMLIVFIGGRVAASLYPRLLCSCSSFFIYLLIYLFIYLFCLFVF